MALRVVYRPAEVFAELTSRPRSLGPVMLLAVAAVFTGAVLPAAALRAAGEQQLERLERRQQKVFAPDVRERALAGATGVSGRTWVGVTVFGYGMLYVGFTAGVLLLVFNALSSAGMRFSEEWAIATHAFIPWIIGSMLTVAMIAVLGNPDFRMSLGFLVSPERNRFGHAFADQFSFFGAWNVYLLALGNKIRTRAESIAAPLLVVGLLWIIANVAVTGLSTALTPPG